MAKLPMPSTCPQALPERLLWGCATDQSTPVLHPPQATCNSLQPCTICRQKHSTLLLQHWLGWARFKGEVKLRGQMVQRAHKGFTLRHAWEHWHWLAASKVVMPVCIS